MMNCCSLLLDEELGEVWVLLGKPILDPLVLEDVSPVLEVLSLEWINLSGLSSLLLLDVSHVGPSAEHEASHDESKPSVALVVEPVWLVPVWEHSHVLMRVRSFVSWLLVPCQLWVHVFLRNVKHRRIRPRVRVGVVESIQSSSTQNHGARLSHLSKGIHF